MSRPRLLERLQAGLDRGIVLVAAPAGYGKSTLLADWRRSPRSRSFPLAWLSLDSDDDEPSRFWLYVVAALQTLDSGSAAPSISFGDTLSLLRSPTPLPWQTILTQLIQELGAYPEPFALVLDDYHRIQRQEIHEGLAYLVEHRPPQMGLAICSRTDPPLPLGRWRVGGILSEIRAADLRFTVQEAGEFLGEVMGVALAEESVVTLAERTEGWIAGLQVAALSLQGRDPDGVASFVQAFSGRHHHVLEYLTDEVLACQAPETQRFLLETSILDRLSGPLCEALEGRRSEGKRIDGEPGAATGQPTLDALDHANLFLVPLDDEHHWYRYHQLFQEILRARLQQTWPDRVPELHRRAAEWHERNGLISESIRHALAAGDEDRADRLIEESVDSTLLEGQYQTLLRWLDAMPAGAFERRPRLQLCRALVLISSSQLDAAERCLDSAERALARVSASSQADESNQGDSDGAAETKSMLALLRALVLVSEGETARALELASSALGGISPDRAVWRCFGCVAAGGCHGLLGDVAASTALLKEARDVAERAGSAGLVNLVLVNLADVQLMTGHLRLAAETYDELLQLAAERGGRGLNTTAGAHAEFAMLLLEWDDLDAALLHAEQAIDLGQRVGNPAIPLMGGLALTRVLLAKGDLAGAIETCESLVKQAREANTAHYRSSAEAIRARIWLTTGDLELARAWANGAAARLSSGRTGAEPPPHPFEYPLSTLARVWIAEGLAGEAREVIGSALPLAREAGRLGREVELLVLQALALGADGSTDLALDAIERALALAEPEGYVRTFLDEVVPLADLLAKLLAESRRRKVATGAESHARNLLARLAGEADRPDPDARRQGSPRRTADGLVEPVSERELEVLRLLAEGLSNQEIARRLYVSPHTVRAHAYNVYGKLGVHSRTEAANRGRRLGLLPLA